MVTRRGTAPASLAAPWLAAFLLVRFHKALAACPGTVLPWTAEVRHEDICQSVNTLSMMQDMGLGKMIGPLAAVAFCVISYQQLSTTDMHCLLDSTLPLEACNIWCCSCRLTFAVRSWTQASIAPAWRMSSLTEAVSAARLDSATIAGSSRSLTEGGAARDFREDFLAGLGFSSGWSWQRLIRLSKPWIAPASQSPFSVLPLPAACGHCSQQRQEDHHMHMLESFFKLKLRVAILTLRTMWCITVSLTATKWRGA